MTHPFNPSRNTFDELRTLAASGFRAGIVYAYPPHSFSTYSDKGITARHQSAKYTVMAHRDILAMGPLVQALAARDCALNLWSSGVFLERSLEIMRAWGFKYVTIGFVWIKTIKSCSEIEPDNLTNARLNWGTGYTTRSNAEFVIIAKRGKPRRLHRDIHQIIISPRRTHSEKPEEAARRIERLYSGPYLELFGRRERPGWTVWGNEVGPLIIANMTEAAE
jgi:N6-adenosine-specific RNA methylase IME4